MSYYNGYNNNRRGGGFRNDNFRNDNHYGFNRNNGNGFSNEPRINETQVPQSKHTIFIRGLHGDTTTEEIKEYIGDKVGRISFDFVKQAPDGSKMFVAVRFEKRDEAKEFMETYSNREFMGNRCELSWFRDIRRYCAYQRAKQIRSTSQRRRRRSGSEGSEKEKRSESPPIRRRTRSRSNRFRSNRSRSNQSESPERRSESRSSSGSRAKSPAKKEKRVSRNRTRSSTRSRSRSQSSQRSDSSKRSETSGDESRASSRAQSREDKKRRRESSVSTDQKKTKIDHPKIPNIPLPSKPSPAKSSPSPAPQKPSVFIPPPSVDMEIESPPQHVSTNPYPQHQQFQNFKTEVSYSMSVDEMDDSPPKMIIRDQTYYPTVQVPEHSYQPAATPVLAPSAPLAPAPAPAPPVTVAPTPAAPSTPTAVVMPTTPSFVPRQIGRIEIVMPATLPAAPAPPAPPPLVTQVTPPFPSSFMMNGAVGGGSEMQAAGDSSVEQLPTTNKIFGHLKAYQSALLSTVKYEIPIKKDDADGDIIGLRLSSMSSVEDPEEMKSMEREQKLARLNDEQMMRFLIQKKKFETAFRNDCETYAVVTRALLAKDESMQFKLKMSLFENMDDLYKQLMKRVDDHLDTILSI